MALYRLLHQPQLNRPILALHFEGFIDAGGAGAAAMQAIHTTSTRYHEVTAPGAHDLGRDSSRAPASPPVSGVGPGDAERAGRGVDTGDLVVAEFDAEALLDYRARRPIMHLVNGVNTSLTWPSIKLSLRRDRKGRELLVLTGPEPDHLWPTFAREVVELAITLGVRLIVNLGVYPTATPHTRPPQVTATTTSADMQSQFAYFPATVDVPSGIHAVIEHESAARGITAVGLWAQVPHYAASMPYPACAIALLEGVRQLTQLEFDTADLAQQAAQVQQHLAEVISRNDEHQQMLRQLEVQDDVLRQSKAADLPSGDEIAAELEQFLREQED